MKDSWKNEDAKAFVEGHLRGIDPDRSLSIARREHAV